MTIIERENWQQEMFTLIKKWKQSGIKQQEFRDRDDISIHMIYYWLRKYKQAESYNSGFIPVEIQGSKEKEQGKGEITIDHPNDVLLTVNDSVKISRIKALINAV